MPTLPQIPPGSPVQVRRGHGRRELGTLTAWDGEVRSGPERASVEAVGWVLFPGGPARIRASKVKAVKGAAGKGVAEQDANLKGTRKDGENGVAGATSSLLVRLTV